MLLRQVALISTCDNINNLDNRTFYCSNGDYILDICTEMEHKKIPFQFVLRRSVWVHPLRLDNPIFIEVMFFQVIFAMIKLI